MLLNKVFVFLFWKFKARHVNFVDIDTGFVADNFKSSNITCFPRIGINEVRIVVNGIYTISKIYWITPAITHVFCYVNIGTSHSFMTVRTEE